MIRSTRRKHVKNEHLDSARDRLMQVINSGTVDAETVLLACAQAMSEDTCESVLETLANCALYGCDSDKETSLEVEPLEPSEFEDSKDELDSDDEEDEAEDTDDEDVEEACRRRRRRQLEMKLSRLERLVKKLK